MRSPNSWQRSGANSLRRSAGIRPSSSRRNTAASWSAGSSRPGNGCPVTSEGNRLGSARSVAVLGAGSWGTTFAKILADAATAAGEPRDIRLWGRRSEVVEEINTYHRNSQYLKDIAL